MGKRIRKITYAFLIVALFTALNTKVSYAERKQLNIEQAVGNPPEITAYVNGEKVSKDAEYTASFKGKDIEFETKSVTKFAKADKPVRYVIFLDNSKSVDEKQFNEVKKSLVNLRKKIWSFTRSVLTVNTEIRLKSLRLTESRTKKAVTKILKR